MQVKKNLCLLDQVLRIGIGAGLIYIGFIETSWIGDATVAIVAGVFGLINVAAALIGYCPIYRLANINTRSMGRSASSPSAE